MYFFRWFVEDNPGEVCPVAGQAAYRDCLRLTRLGDTEAGGFPQYAVNASSFMAFHSILKTSQVSQLINPWVYLQGDTSGCSLGFS